MRTPGKRTSRFATEKVGNPNLRDNLDKHDTRNQLANGGRILPNSSVAPFDSRQQWPRSYQNAMNSRIVAGPDITQVFKKIMEVIVWTYGYLLEKKRACLPDCLP